jgi:hypothetical protein
MQPVLISIFIALTAGMVIGTMPQDLFGLSAQQAEEVTPRRTATGWIRRPPVTSIRSLQPEVGSDQPFESLRLISFADGSTSVRGDIKFASPKSYRRYVRGSFAAPRRRILFVDPTTMTYRTFLMTGQVEDLERVYRYYHERTGFDLQGVIERAAGLRSIAALRDRSPGPELAAARPRPSGPSRTPRLEGTLASASPAFAPVPEFPGYWSCEVSAIAEVATLDPLAVPLTYSLAWASSQSGNDPFDGEYWFGDASFEAYGFQPSALGTHWFIDPEYYDYDYWFTGGSVGA